MTRPPSPRLVPSGFFVLRTPLLPYEALTGGDCADGNGRARLTALLARPEVRESILLASPRVAAGIDRWFADPDSDESRRLEPVLASYVLRAATRPAPFGLFAGWTTGTIGSGDATTMLQLEGLSRYRRHSRLDTDYLTALAVTVVANRNRRRGLPHRPNSSLYPAAGRWHMAECRSRDGRRSYHLVAIEPTSYLTATLQRAGRFGPGGGVTLGELADALVDGDITPADARAYIDELVDRQVLVADFGAPLTGPDPGEHLAALFAATPVTAHLAGPLEEAQLALAALDDRPLGCHLGAGSPAEGYSTVRTTLAELGGSPPTKTYVRVDLEKPARAAILGPDVLTAVREGIHLLHRLARPGDDPGLTRFREEFLARYDTRAVPLTEALDEEVGIGFERIESPAAEAPDLLTGVFFRTAPEVGTEDDRWTPSDAALLRLLAPALRDGAAEIELTPDHIAELEAAAGGPRPPLPEALSATVRLSAPSAADLAAGRVLLYISSAGGPSGAELLGRLCGVDKVLLAGVETHLRAEEAQRPSAVFAEIVHLPEGRDGNVLARPLLRRYEIPYLGQSGAPPDAQIPITDLLVSVRDERIVLQSRTLGVEVLPRLTTAHLHSRPGLPLYRFLGRLQYQGVAAQLGWDWGALAGAPFLPRVVAGRIVLALARFRLAGRDLEILRSAGPERTRALTAWRESWRVPRFVALVDDDEELVFDLEDELWVDALAHQLRGRTAADFVEMFPGPEDLAVSGPDGRFVHDLIVPFVTEANTEAGGLGLRTGGPAAFEGPRRFPPGSEWLYAKLYTGSATADRVLLGAIAPLAERVLAAGAAVRWFFVRYADPDPHLRVRFNGQPDRLHHEVQPALEEAAGGLLRDGVIWRLQFDTYEREVERYGGDEAMEPAEEIFAADSEAVIELMAGPAGRSDLRWRAALVGIARLVEDLGLSPEEQRRLAAEARHAYGAEFGVGGQFQQAVSRRFRSERAGLEALIAAAEGSVDRLAREREAIRIAFDRRSARIRSQVDQLRRLDAADRLFVPMDGLAWSLGHMHVNRLLRAAPRAQELVIYEFLDRLWTARAARWAGGPAAPE